MVLQRAGSHVADHKAIGKIIAEYEPDVIVVGLPLSLNGSESHAAALVRAEVAEMERAFAVPIVLHDERFTTATAHASMIERKMTAQQRRQVVDKVAAAVLLQNWLDAESYRRNAAAANSINQGSANADSAPTDPVESGSANVIEPGSANSIEQEPGKTTTRSPLGRLSERDAS